MNWLMFGLYYVVVLLVLLTLENRKIYMTLYGIFTVGSLIDILFIGG